LSSFVAAFPMNRPRYVLLVSLDEPKGNKKSLGYATAGWVAAPAAREIVERIAPILKIPRQAEERRKTRKQLLASADSRPRKKKRDNATSSGSQQ